jgi:hypothetical protein
MDGERSNVRLTVNATFKLQLRDVSASHLVPSRHRKRIKGKRGGKKSRQVVPIKFHFRDRAHCSRKLEIGNYLKESVRAGVLRGSLRGPLLFSICTNDLSHFEGNNFVFND